MARTAHYQLTIAASVVALGILGQVPSARGQETPLQSPDTTAEGGARAAEAEEPATESKKTSYELRFTLTSPSARWSKVEARNDMLARHADRSLYFGPGLGLRVFIKQPHHGLLVDFDYKVDTDIDSLNVTSGWKTDFAIAHVGYGYRFIKHTNDKMTWAFTPHASFSAG
jgi:hypothetical protein